MGETFCYRSRMPGSARQVYEFHKQPGALEQLTPPWVKMGVLERTGGIEDVGSRVIMKVRTGLFFQKWIAQHTAFEPGKMFCDEMVKGPFRRWVHTHRFLEESEESSWLEDCIEYELPLGRLGKFFASGYVRRKLRRMFEWRHGRTAETIGARKMA